jgi:hypothetical protein
LLPLVAGVLAAAAAVAVTTTPMLLRPRSPAWTRLSDRAGPAGALADTAAVHLPGLERRAAGWLEVEAEAASGGGAIGLGVALDGGPAQWIRTGPGEPGAVVVPRGPPGLRVTLVRPAGAPAPRVLSLRGERPGARAGWGAAVLAALAAAAMARGTRRALGPQGALAAALVAGAAVALAFAPALLWLDLPSPRAAARLAAPVALLAGAAALGFSRSAAERRDVALVAAVTLAFVFGAWVRAYFLPSAGSWDTEYWKAWTARMAEHGLTHVYGPPEPFDARHFAARLRGAAPLPQADSHGRAFVVDYPPLGMALLHGSWALVSRWPHGLPGDEARNVAAKLPAVVGDMAAVALLLAGFPGRPRRALALAALYWAAPPSLLSSAVLGYTDGAYAPLSLAALWMAGRGRGGWAGALLATAGLIKPTALVAAPAVAVSLWPARRALGRAILAGASVTLIVMAPFVIAGTAALAAAQVARIFFQKTFSGGFANLWWLAGHLTATGEGWREPVRFVPLGSVDFPVAAVALALFAAAAVTILRAQKPATGPYAAALAGGALVLAYGMLAVGVHDNHPHAMVLLLIGCGLFTPRLGLLCAGLLVTDTLNLLALSGLGRFYGTRHALVEAMGPRWDTFRMFPGFDLTLLLAGVNLGLFAALLAGLRAEIRATSARDPGIASVGGPRARAII